MSAVHLHTKQFSKFTITGTVTTIVDLGCLTLFMEVAKISLRPSVALGALVGFTVAFFMNKYWSFKNGAKKVFRQYSYFIALYSVSFFIGVGLTVYLTETMNLWYLFSRLVAIMLGGLLNYMWLHHIVFVQSKT
ncbi:TPA: hypothetical protein DE059_03635 [Candidatus Peribacteria bacterium]|jgi:putative flippase GtrA|nr:hypothetical protein [Candidatus Peribacteria bacterium]|tara:strand:- start:947 stop:1348 length:402 start_codon:yes stop_codon:yes gene_type:complete